MAFVAGTEDDEEAAATIFPVGGRLAAKSFRPTAVVALRGLATEVVVVVVVCVCGGGKRCRGCLRQSAGDDGGIVVTSRTGANMLHSL